MKLSDLELPPKVLTALERSHAALHKLGIPHVLVGGVAVNSYGHAYTTKDVDYLVDVRDAFEGTLVVSHKPGVPFQVGDVGIDYVLERKDFPAQIKRAFRDALKEASSKDDLAVIEDWVLIWMKLNAGRTKDLAAVEGLIANGTIDAKRVDLMLDVTGPSKVRTLWKACKERAEEYL